MTDDSYLTISEKKLSITLLYIISDTPKCDIIWTENSDVIDRFISEILKYETSGIVSLTGYQGAILFTPFFEHFQISEVWEVVGRLLGGCWEDFRRLFGGTTCWEFVNRLCPIIDSLVPPLGPPPRPRNGNFLTFSVDNWNR